MFVGVNYVGLFLRVWREEFGYSNVRKKKNIQVSDFLFLLVLSSRHPVIVRKLISRPV